MKTDSKSSVPVPISKKTLGRTDGLRGSGGGKWRETVPYCAVMVTRKYVLSVQSTSRTVVLYSTAETPSVVVMNEVSGVIADNRSSVSNSYSRGGWREKEEEGEEEGDEIGEEEEEEEDEESEVGSDVE